MTQPAGSIQGTVKTWITRPNDEQSRAPYNLLRVSFVPGEDEILHEAGAIRTWGQI